jgi:hypothetical protein
MAQITQPQRIQRIDQLVKELNKIPPERHEVERLPWAAGEPLLCPVIKMKVDEVLLYHRSHRVRAQLQDDPEWVDMGKDPHSEAAQRLIERHVRDARKPEQFADLKESLQREGQTHPGVMTYDGVLVNANTRAVALRELEDPAKRYIRVAVLPASAEPEELALLELRLQMQKELKVDYSLTNELLFIEELSSERGLSDAQIARELRVDPKSEKKGEAEVRFRLRMLDLIRDMQRIPQEALPLTFFDTLGYEQLREAHRTYHGLLEGDPDEARPYLESFLLSIAVGVTPVHQIRKIDPAFMSQYMLPQLEEDEVIGDVASRLLEPTDGSDTAQASAGAKALLGDDDEKDAGPVDLKGLINVVTGRDKRVDVSGTPLVLERDDVKEALKAAIITGVKEKKRDEKDADKLEAPISAVKAATREIDRGVEAVKTVADDEEFDSKRRKSLEAAHKKLKRSCRELETALTKAEVIGD